MCLGLYYTDFFLTHKQKMLLPSSNPQQFWYLQSIIKYEVVKCPTGYRSSMYTIEDAQRLLRERIDFRSVPYLCDFLKQKMEGELVSSFDLINIKVTMYLIIYFKSC